MSKTNNLEPYHINYVDASWLSIERNTAGIFIDFNINAGDKVTYEFTHPAENGQDQLIIYIENTNNLQKVINYTNALYEQTINASGLPLKIKMVITDVLGRKNTINLDPVFYTLGTYAPNSEYEYVINYVSAPYASYTENRSVYIIINMDLREGDIVCGHSFKLYDQCNDEFTVNVISYDNIDRPLMRYAGIFGPFATNKSGVLANASVNGGLVSSPVGIKSYGNHIDKNIHQSA